jgi:hypothetical protein
MSQIDDFLDGGSASGSSIDRFLDSTPAKAQKQNTSLAGDIGTGLKRGVLQMPGMVTGLADLATTPIALATGVNRPISKAADWAGEKTGFQPEKWAKNAEAEYSPEMQQAQANVEKAQGFFPTIGAVAENPRVAAQLVAESLPSTIAGGVLARGAMGAVMGAEKLAALRAAAGSADVAVANAAKAQLLKSGAIAAGIGEGAVTSGQQMSQTGYEVDPALAASTALAAGIGTGVIGAGSGRLANSAIGKRLGLSDLETSMAAGTLGENAGKAGLASYAKRIGAGTIQEGLLEEAPQSYQEQVWQNLASGKPWDEGAASAAAQGAIAGGLMGGAVNAIPRKSTPAPEVPPAIPDPSTGGTFTPDPNGGVLERGLSAMATAKADVDALAPRAIDTIDRGLALVAPPTAPGFIPDSELPIVGQPAPEIDAQPIDTGETLNQNDKTLREHFQAQRIAAAADKSGAVIPDAVREVAETRPQIPDVRVPVETQNTKVAPEANNGPVRRVDMALPPAVTQQQLADQEANRSTPRASEQLFTEDAPVSPAVQPTQGTSNGTTTTKTQQAEAQGQAKQPTANVTADNISTADESVNTPIDGAKGTGTKTVQSVTAAVEPAPVARPAALPNHHAAKVVAKALPEAQDVQIHSTDSLSSEKESGASGRMSKWRGKTIERLAKVFGRKRVVFFSSANTTADGMNIGGGDTLYVNIDSGVDPIAVVGHEWRHALKTSNAAAHAAINQAATKLLDQPGRLLEFAKAYHAAELKQEDGGSEDLKKRMARIEAGEATDEDKSFLAEEFSADMTGNLWRDPKALREVFDTILDQHPPSAARTIIKSIGDAIIKLIDKLIISTPKGQYSEMGISRDELLGLKKEIQAAMADSFKQDVQRRMDKVRAGNGGELKFSKARKGEPAQDIVEGKLVEQSTPLTENQWQSVRSIALGKLNPEDRARALDAEEKYLAAETRANRDSEKYKEIAQKRLRTMAAPQLSSVSLMTGDRAPKITPTGKHGKKRVIDVARVLRKRVLARAADLKSPMGKEAVARAIVHEALYSMSLDGHAIGWYDRKVREAVAVQATANPEILTDKTANLAFRIIAAVTSNGQAVRDNFILANDLYQLWRKDGAFPTTFTGGGTRALAMMAAFGKLNLMIKQRGVDNTESELMTLRTVREIENEFGVKINGEGKDAIVPTAVGMGGPKIGNFFANLSGYFDSPTMDLWFMRTVGRMTGGIIATKPGLAVHLDKLLTLLPESGEVNGVKVAKIREEIAQYKELTPEERLDPEVTLRVLKNTEVYGRAQYAKFAAGDENGKTFLDKSPENENSRSLKTNLSALIETPAGPSHRNQLRDVVIRSLQLLKTHGIDLSAADLQAVLWYYEKNLYGKLGDINESAKPWDYASAARFGVGRQLGLVDVGTSDRAGQVRSGQPEVYGDESGGVDESDGFSDQEVSSQGVKKSTARGVNIEVAPDPRDVAAKAAFEKLSEPNKKAVTYAVAQKVIPKLLSDMGIKGQIEYTIGGFEGGTAPAIIVHFEDSVPYAQVREFAIASGALLRQQASISYDENDTTSEGQTTFVYVEPSRTLSYEEQQALFKDIHARYPDAKGFTGRDGLLVFGNFDRLDDAEFHNGIDTALQSAIKELDYDAKTSAKTFLSDWHEPLNVEETQYGQSNESATRRTDDNGRKGFFDTLQSESDQLVRSETAKYSTPRSDGAGSNSVRKSGPRVSYGSPKEGASQVEGLHFSQEKRDTLDSTRYGQGLPGAEGQRLGRDSATQEQKQRIHFYVNEGKGVTAESGVGYHAHAVKLNNLYDWKADTLGLFDEAIQKFNNYDDQVNYVEQQAMARGFDGVYARGAQGDQGVAVLLGPHIVPVDYLGMGKQTTEVATPMVPKSEGKQTFEKLQQSVMANKSIPGGEMTGADWKRMMPKLMPEIDVSHLADDQKYYKDGLVKRPEVKRSTPREITTSINRVYKDDRLYEALDFGQANGSGPFDGGCLICAKAILRAFGGGDLVRIVNEKTDETDHYGARIDGVIYDFSGSYRRPSAWIAQFKKSENVKHEQSFAEGYDETSDIPDDPTSEKEIAKLLTEDADIRFSPPRFFSQLATSIDQIQKKMETMPAPQWRMWLTGNAPKLGIKKDEIVWSGIDDYLTLRGKDKVTKAEVQQFLSENGTQVNDVVLGVEPKEGARLREINKELETATGRRREALVLEHAELGEKFRDGLTQPKFGQYVGTGGENYRELLITLPGKSELNVVPHPTKGGFAIQYGNGAYVTSPDGGATTAQTFDPDKASQWDKKEYISAWLRSHDKAQFYSSHFDQPNILAHLRMDERTDAQGDKVLFLEELQSDFGQQGEKLGFVGQKPDDESKLVELKAKLANETDADKRAALGKSIAKIDKRISGDDYSVPQAPIVTDTKSWVALGLKRAIMYAVQNGMSKVAWASGEQNAGHYDLSKQVDAIDYSLRSDGVYHLSLVKDGQTIMDKPLQENELEDAVGKDVAEKIVKGEGEASPRATSRSKIKRISGLDLKVGGEGMRAFYDQIVPQVANDVLKKLGGGKVETVELMTPDHDMDVVAAQLPDSHLWGIYDRYRGKWLDANEQPAEDEDTAANYSERAARAAAAAILRGSLETNLQQQGFTIPPSMAEKVQTDGVPLFSPARAQTETPEFKKWSHGNQLVRMGSKHVFKAGHGVVVEALHGSTGDFSIFDKSKSNIESDMGGGFYFTNTKGDVGSNYAGMGPDLTGKIGDTADQIRNFLEDDEWADGKSDDEINTEAFRRARDQFMANEGVTMPVYVRFDNPVVLGGPKETFLDYNEEYNEDTDSYDEPTGKLVDFVAALREVASDDRYNDADIEKAIANIWSEGKGDYGESASGLLNILNMSEGLMYATDNESNFGASASREIVRKAFEQMGFDGIIDQTVNQKFGSKKKIGQKLTGMDNGTVHFIAFEPTQIKSAIGNNGQFDPTNQDIRFSPPRYEVKRDEEDEGTFAVALSNDQKNRNGDPLQVAHLHVPDEAVSAAGWRIGDIQVTKALRRQGIASELVRRMSEHLGSKPIGAASVFSEDGKRFFENAKFSPARAQTETPEFKKWFGDSKVVDAEGKPLLVYRGEKGGDNTYNTTRGTPTFTDSINIAKFYAEEANDEVNSGKAGEVKPAYISIVNPLRFGDDSGVTTIEQLVGMAKQINMSTQDLDDFVSSGNWVLDGEEVSGSLPVKLDRFYDKYTRNWVVQAKDVFDNQIGTAIYVATKPEAKKVSFSDFDVDEAIPPGAYIENFLVADSRLMQDAANEAGYDGFIYRGVFMGEEFNEEDGSSFDGVTALEYRPFDLNQIKSAIGNNGQFDAKNPDIRFSPARGPAPKKTVTAYKLFRVDAKKPGQLFPLFVDANTPVPVGEWLDAEAGELTSSGKVKSKLGPLAYRPGWHAGDLPLATHIGEGGQPPTHRPANQVWAEVELAADKDWQAEANKRGTNPKGKIVPVKAHITDQLPVGGHYRYKTNPNMTGEWMISGTMKVIRVLTDAEVAEVNSAVGLADLPRKTPFDPGKFGFDVKRSTPRGAITNQPINQSWQDPDNLGKWDDFVRTMQDKLVDTKRVIAAIRSAGVAIKDTIDPYLQEVLYHGRAAKRVSDFADNELRPLLVEMGARKIERQELEDYLWARHATERNAQIAKINPKMQDGGSGLTNQQAADILSGQAVNIGGRDIKLNLRQMPGYRSLASKIDAITKETTDTLVRYGLETQDTVDAWRNTYGKYVPLMRDMEADDNYSGAFNLGLGTGQGFSVRGSASKRALGSERGVIDILANVAMQRERAIVRGEKNRVAQSMYGLAITAPNPDFWLPLNPDAKKSPAQVTAELVALGLNPIDAANIANEPKQRYTDPNTGMVMERVNPQLRSRGDVLAVRINGKDRYVMFSSNERAQKMVAGLKNLDVDQLGMVMQKMAVVTRWFAAINTQFNPVFGMTNGIRDLGTGMLNLESTELKGHQAEVLKNAISALRGVYSDLRDHRAGRTPTSRWALEYEEYALEGGQTGYRDMFQTSRDRTEGLMQELKDATKGKTLLTFSEKRSPLFGWLSDYNTSIENAIRLSAYKAAKDKGMTKAQAASLAKNLTVNFNKKGLAATQLGAMYAFFNAAAQGTARIGQTLVKVDNGKFSLTGAGKKIVYGGMMAGVLQAAMFAAAGYDDEEPPQFIREKNFIIPLPDGKYLSVPYPLGFHVIPNIGRVASEFVLGGFKNPGKRLVDMFSMIMDGFNPIGGSSGGVSQMLSPTVTDPLVALSENKDWTGKSIYKEDFNAMHPTAGWTRKKDTASDLSRWMAYGINYLTGGGKYEIGLLSPTPDQLDYLIGQGTGGVGRESLKAWQFGATAATGENMPMYKVPIAGRFVGETTGQASETSKFYNNLKRIGEHKAALDEMQKARDLSAMIEYRKENPDAALVKQADKASTDISELKRRKRELLEKGSSPEQIKLMEAVITTRVKRYNEMLSARN